jgi:predicted RNA-binding protein YlxR (DUF448 family)
MAQNSYSPTRMCITCRGRFEQNLLLRLRCEDKSLQRFSNNGRSFYLCEDCLKNENKVVKALMRQCKIGDVTNLSNQLKEIIAKTWKKLEYTK